MVYFFILNVSLKVYENVSIGREANFYYWHFIRVLEIRTPHVSGWLRYDYFLSVLIIRVNLCLARAGDF